MEDRKKFCQRCRSWMELSSFSVVRLQFGYSKDRLCTGCRQSKTIVSAKRSSIVKGYGHLQRRQRELALIVSPFRHFQETPPDNQHFLWGETV
jgi:hypothetical protein